MAQISFNASAVQPKKSFEPIPAGSYIASISESAIKPTSKGTGQIMNLTFDILDGQYKGRKVFDRINIQNQNPTAEKIGQEQLSALCHAVGVLQLQDTNQLHGRPVTIKVKIRKDDTGQYEDSNEVTGYLAANGAVPAASAPAAPAAAPAAPWLKK